MLAKDLKEVKDDAKRHFGGIRGVCGFGIGKDSVRVYVDSPEVKQKFPKQRFPDTFEGVRLDFIVTGNIGPA
jgi:hypothetical protein